jgi:GntP family gluconate:H+ symporter
MSHDFTLIASAVVAVALLILLIARFKLNAFVALILASIVAGIFSGMELPAIAKAFGEGVGAVLASIAMVVGLGAILGKMLGESGGAEVIAETITRGFGPARLPWAMLVIALIVGFPVFFAVGLVLLIPIVAAVAQRSGVPFLRLAFPMVAGLSVAHGLIPPHPGPMLAVESLQADPGKTILYSLIIGIPAAIIAGPLFVKSVATIEAPPPLSNSALRPTHRPSFAISIFTVLLPALLMLTSTAADLLLPAKHSVRSIADFLGNPLCAMTISALVSFYTFGIKRGFTRAQILKFSEDCLGPTASVLLVVGAGGGFNKVLITSGIGGVISNYTTHSRLSPLLLGWLVAALVRVATGSATVAISAAAGILAPIAAAQPINRELLVIAMGSGSLILSHLNDGGFWFVKEYLNLSVPQTLRTWTVIETIISVTGLLGALLLIQFLN